MSSNFVQETVSSRVEEIIYEQIGHETVLSPETDLLNDLGLDSLELVELGLNMEKVFGTTLPMPDLRKCVTVEDIAQLVQQKKSEG